MWSRYSNWWRIFAGVKSLESVESPLAGLDHLDIDYLSTQIIEFNTLVSVEM